MLVISLIILLLLVGLISAYLYSIVSGAPYVGSQDVVIKNIVAFAEIRPNQKVIDIGSGDGRMVNAFAKLGCRSYGIELNPVLVWYSRWKIGRNSGAMIYNADLWSHNYSGYDVVYAYAMPHLMKRLQTKLMKELKPGAKVVTNAFQFPDWKATKVAGRLHLYIKN
jgi:16S rRNA A1518/A1519 N6-dimethyltransferase RsmA/KsgA/DIM1 with predicted DNA glycosylase/AP lyase activity